MHRVAGPGTLPDMTRRLTHQQIIRLASVLPADRPYLFNEATKLGVNHQSRRVLMKAGMIVSRTRGVFQAAGLKDCLELRIAILSLVVPADCVVTDRTAAWLWGAHMALAPNDHLTVPRVSVFAPPGRRLRNGLIVSGERDLTSADVVQLDGLQVTTPLRTACDLLRLLHRDQALAAGDALAALGQFAVDHVVAELTRFKGYRGIIQARALAPLLDPGAESAMESISRLRWHDAGLPRPQCQVIETAPGGSWYAIDIGLPDELFGVEFFGEEFHAEDQAQHDDARLAWLRVERRWTIVVARKVNVIGPAQDLDRTLRAEWAAHRARNAR
jgi:hypothetical protein